MVRISKTYSDCAAVRWLQLYWGTREEFFIKDAHFEITSAKQAVELTICYTGLEPIDIPVLVVRTNQVRYACNSIIHQTVRMYLSLSELLSFQEALMKDTENDSRTGTKEFSEAYDEGIQLYPWP